ncbi:MAG: DNA repair protein RecO [Ruminococcaceae bacterium]|nr:DNA repair protein RecO [Oscillospiraceae bacterium]
MTSEVRGLVIRTVDIKETDRLVTIFTEEYGAITALARGARSLKSRKLAATMQFCYGKYILYKQGDKLWVKEAELIESFFDIRATIEGLALANYIAEVLSFVTVEESEKDLLRLSLNSLYAISTGKYDVDKIKAAFEIRAVSILGFMPNVLSCNICDEKSGDFFFDIMGGIIECRACHDKRAKARIEHADPHESHILCILSEGAKIALGYCIYSPLERIFSFNISGDDMRLFSKAAEEYILNQLGRSYKSLEFYKSVKR